MKVSTIGFLLFLLGLGTFSSCYFGISNPNGIKIHHNGQTPDHYGDFIEILDAFFKNKICDMSRNLTVNQVFTFIDERTGAKHVPAKNTGFKIKHTSRETSPGSGKFEAITEKMGANATANGYSSEAGNCNISTVQPV